MAFFECEKSQAGPRNRKMGHHDFEEGEGPRRYVDAPLIEFCVHNYLMHELS